MAPNDTLAYLDSLDLVQARVECDEKQESCYDPLSLDEELKLQSFHTAATDTTESTTGYEEGEEDEIFYVHPSQTTTQLQSFHKYYIQLEEFGGEEYYTPVSFEDGMDYEECELYYSYRNELVTGRASRRDRLRRRPLQKPAALEGPPKSILRNKDSSRVLIPRASDESGASNNSSNSSGPVLTRRCSFSALPCVDYIYDDMPPQIPSHHISTDVEDFCETKVGVSFLPFTTVATIYSAKDLPADIHAGCWMSRVEMVESIRNSEEEHEDDE